MEGGKLEWGEEGRVGGDGGMGDWEGSVVVGGGDSGRW